MVPFSFKFVHLHPKSALSSLPFSLCMCVRACVLCPVKLVALGEYEALEVAVLGFLLQPLLLEQAD